MDTSWKVGEIVVAGRARRRDVQSDNARRIPLLKITSALPPDGTSLVELGATSLADAYITSNQLEHSFSKDVR